MNISKSPWGSYFWLLLYKQDRTKGLPTAKSELRVITFSLVLLTLGYGCLPKSDVLPLPLLLISFLPSLVLLTCLSMAPTFPLIFVFLFQLSLKTIADYKRFSLHSSEHLRTSKITLPSSILHKKKPWGSKQIQLSNSWEQSFLGLWGAGGRIGSPNF